MQASNEILMQASPDAIYELAARVERWPELLPHYREVRVLSDTGATRIVEMAARRGRLPLRWTAEQRLFPEVPRITFHHIKAVTAGMDVEWSFSARPEGVLVRIDHELDLGWPLIGGLVADRIIGPQFISHIATKTLRRIKELAERDARMSGTLR